MDNLTFPILWINQSEKNLGVFLDLDQLTSCTPGSQGFFNNLLLVCPDGVIKRVERAVKIGKANSSPGVPKILTWLGMGLIRVKLYFSSDNELIQFPDLVKLVVKLLYEDEEKWDSDGELDELVNKIESSTSFLALVDIMEKRCWPSFSEKGGAWYRL